MRATRTLTVVGCHAGGEVGNVVVGGVLPPPGETVYERMQALRADDSLRRLLLREPRGSVAVHANVIVPSLREDCAAGFIIMEPTEYPAMSGSNTICVATVLLETGMVAMREPETTLRLEAPAGVVEARAACHDGRCESVELTNVPCFADRLDAPLEVDGLGTLSVDVAYGGMWYAIADAHELGFTLEPSEARELSLTGERIRAAAREQLPCVHPENPAIAGISIVQIAEPWQGVGALSRNAVTVAPGRIDRSATGTGLSARMAALHARGLMRVADVRPDTLTVDGREVGARVVIGADGCNGTSARALGLGEHIVHGVALEANVPYEVVPRERYRGAMVLEIAVVPGGYGWIFPKGDHVNVGVGGNEAEAPRLRAHLRRLCEEHGIDCDALTETRGYRLPMRRAGSRLARGTAAVIGDAAGLLDPFSGDGLYEAFLSSQLVATATLDLLAGRAAGLEPYERAVARQITPLTAAGWGAKAAFERFPRIAFALAELPAAYRALEQLLLGEIGHPAEARGLEKAALVLIYVVAQRAGNPGRAYGAAA